ncbi:vacuolar protein 8-like [Canna indica]|uniref:Vacuolar protein 8-like n=1 Tax=Canna indica TaxID=4628 RepID=A0AAQ3KZS1_9LILI|nr:vacuolar protein 8-like [Canna indica]
MDSEMNEEKEGCVFSPPQHGEISLRRALELIHALISSTYCIRFFPVKWRLIRDKLEQLLSGLSAAADGVDCSELMKLLESVISTLYEAQVLADKCSDESYRGGKLLLKSDVEIIASKIEQQLKILYETCVISRVLTHSQAIILLKPAAGANREDMKFYLKDLIARLKLSDSKMKIGALSTLNDALHEDEKYVTIMVVEISGGVPLLVNLLELGDTGVQEEAAEAIYVISAFDSFKGALVTAGVIAPLIRVLEKGSELAKVRAARALKKLTENSENSWSVSAQGGVSTLLKICGNVDSSGELIQSACGILKCLGGVDEIKRFMVEEGAVSVLVNLSKSKEESSKIQALELLTMVASDDDIKHLVVKEEVVGSLVQVLDPSSPHSSKAREVALRAIENLCFSSPSSMNLLMNSSFLERVLFFLRNGETSVQESAIKTVSRLCGLSETSKKVMGDAGFMPELVELLEAKSFPVREMAAEALCGMMSVPRNKSRFIQEDQNVNRILQLLNPEDEKSATKKFLLSAVMSLTDSKSVRRKIIASAGCMKYLEKLAETDVADAKKIVKKLSGNRFLSILTGIWS